MKRQTVKLGRADLFKGELRARIQQLLDPANPVRRLEKLRKIVRVSTIGDAIVSVCDYSLGWIVDVRKLLESNITEPIVILVPTADREQRSYAATARNLAGESVTDVSSTIGINEVQTRRRVIAQTVEKLVPGLCAIDAVDTVQFLTRLLSAPARAQNFSTARQLRKIADRRAMACKADNFLNRRLTADCDALFASLKFFPALSGKVKIRLDGVHLLAIDLGIIAQRRSDSPRDAAIMADLYKRHARNRGTPNFVCVCPRQVGFSP